LVEVVGVAVVTFFFMVRIGIAVAAAGVSTRTRDTNTQAPERVDVARRACVELNDVRIAILLGTGRYRARISVVDHGRFTADAPAGKTALFSIAIKRIEAVLIFVARCAG